jgi:hypothetical protein
LTISAPAGYLERMTALPRHARLVMQSLCAAALLAALPACTGTTAAGPGHPGSRASGGSLRIASAPVGARIVLDGAATSFRTPTAITGLSPGRHRLELTLPGHRPWRGEATVREGHTTDLLVTLEQLKARQVGSARIESDPPGASISIGGVPLRRKTPTELEGLAAGAVPVEISRPGSQTWQGVLTVAPGECTVLAVSLQPESRHGGSVRIESRPPGARVTVDGVPWEAPTPTVVPNLSAAGHRVELFLPGFRPWADMAQVSEGTTGVVSARLVPRPFAISARVAGQDGTGCTVELAARRADGSLAEGTVELELAAAGSRRIERSELAAGATRIRVPLPPDAAEIVFSVLLGDQREVFLLRRGAGGWEVRPPE